MTLLEGKIGQEYQVTGLDLEENIMRRLESLGIFEGTRIRILNKKKAGSYHY